MQRQQLPNPRLPIPTYDGDSEKKKATSGLLPMRRRERGSKRLSGDSTHRDSIDCMPQHAHLAKGLVHWPGRCPGDANGPGQSDPFRPVTGSLQHRSATPEKSRALPKSSTTRPASPSASPRQERLRREANGRWARLRPRAGSSWRRPSCSGPGSPRSASSASDTPVTARAVLSSVLRCSAAWPRVPARPPGGEHAASSPV